MKKLLPIVFIFLALFVFSLFTPSSALAQNICGVNIAGLYHQIDQVASLVKPGGWVVTMGNTCACSAFEGMFGHGLNVVIRTDNGGRGFTEEEAIAWVATLGNMDSNGQMIYFMPWNEPNHSAEGGGPTAGNKVYQYSEFLKSHLEASGLLGTKVTLLSPMVDKLNPSFEGFFTNPGGKAGFYSLFDGSSINEYDLFTPGPCTASRLANNCMYDQIGIPAPFYSLETGVAGTCNPPCYDDNDIRRMLDVSWGKWSSDPNFEMFAILSYDPHRQGDFNIFTAPQTTSFYQNHCSPGGVTPGSFNAGQFNQWLAEHEDELLPCNSCFYPESIPQIPPEEPPTVPPDFFPPGSLQCRPELVGDRDSRPYHNLDCDLCNLTGLFCSSCATSFTVFDEVKWQRKERDLVCEGEGNPDWKITPWEGSITIDPTQTKIPFVGKKRVEITGRVDKEHEDEQKYLADYFEGTHGYYRRYPLSIPFPILGDVDFFHGVNPILTTNYQGVFRKLAPMGYQDQLKEKMIERARETQTENIHKGGVHNYEINYVRRICWNAPFWLEVALQLANRIVDEIFSKTGKKIDLEPSDIAHYCIYGYNTSTDYALINIAKGVLDEWNNSPLVSLSPFLKVNYFYQDQLAQQMLTLEGNYPPDSSEEDYIEKWNDWKFKNLEKREFTDAGKLWELVPMFSREDTPGKITPYLGSKPEDTFEILNPKAQVEKVPHVARLYESTQEVQKMLVPFYKEDLQFSQNKSEPILASAKNSQPIIASPAEEKVQGEKTLLAQGGWDFCDPSGTACCNLSIRSICCSKGTGTVIVDGKGYGHIRVEINGQHVGNNALDSGMTYHFGCPTTPGDTTCVSVYVENYDLHYPVSESCCMSLDEESAACCAGQPYEPPMPACGFPPADPVYACEQLAITDSNPNDDLCCEPINIKLEAKDMFNDYNYTGPCNYSCGDTGTELCNPECNIWEHRTVNREIGINLLHPYLTDIWNQTGLAETAGLFNFFRPAKITEFREIDASSEIVYTQSGFDSIAPSIGKFYFNYLGGVQLAKEWVTRALMPWKE